MLSADACADDFTGGDVCDDFSPRGNSTSLELTAHAYVSADDCTDGLTCVAMQPRLKQHDV